MADLSESVMHIKYQLNHSLILLTVITEKVTIKKRNANTQYQCAVINHLFFTLLSMSAGTVN